MFPHRSVHNSWVGGVHGEICCARLIINLKYRLPRVPAVSRSIYTTLFTWSPNLPLDGHIDKVGIRWVDNDPGNLTRVRESYVFPGFTGIGRLVHAIAMAGRNTTNRSLTCANVDNVFI